MEDWRVCWGCGFLFNWLHDQRKNHWGAHEHHHENEREGHGTKVGQLILQVRRIAADGRCSGFTSGWWYRRYYLPGPGNLGFYLPVPPCLALRYLTSLSCPLWTNTRSMIWQRKNFESRQSERKGGAEAAVAHTWVTKLFEICTQHSFLLCFIDGQWNTLLVSHC